MPKRSADHAALVLERGAEAPPARTVAAQADPATGARWFVDSGDRRRERRELDVRVDGAEDLGGAAVLLDQLGAERQRQPAGSQA